MLLIVAGGFEAIQAFAAIVNDEYLVVAPNYIYTFDLTTGGWVHLLVGLALVAIGICLLLGQGWALIAGIVSSPRLSALINFTWLPYSPLWAILMIAVDVLIIWALASDRAQTRAAQRTPASEHHSGQLTRQDPEPQPGPSAAVRHPGARGCYLVGLGCGTHQLVLVGALMAETASAAAVAITTSHSGCRINHHRY